MKKTFWILGLSLALSFLCKEKACALVLSADTFCCVDDQWYTYSFTPIEACLRGNEIVIAFYDTPLAAKITVWDDSDNIIVEDSFVAPKTVSLFVDDPKRCCKIEIQYNDSNIIGYFYY